MVKLVNRAKMKVASGGAGTLTLGTACDGYQTFAAGGVTDQDKLRYTIIDGNDWEIGVGTYTASGTTLARAPTESSNSGNAITCGSGAEIFVTMAAEDFSGNAAPLFTGSIPAEILLGIDGTTAVTLDGAALDDNGFPITYSWDGSSGTDYYDDDSLPPQLQSAPTINQTTGAVSLIGSNTMTNAGSFNFRLKASDGVKTASIVTSAKLSFLYETGMIAYYDAGSYSGSGTQWLDSSGNGLHMTLATDGSMVYNSSGTGSQPSFTLGKNSSNAHVFEQFSSTHNYSGTTNLFFVAIMRHPISQNGYGQAGFIGRPSGTQPMLDLYDLSQYHYYATSGIYGGNGAGNGDIANVGSPGTQLYSDWWIDGTNLPDLAGNTPTKEQYQIAMELDGTSGSAGSYPVNATKRDQFHSLMVSNIRLDTGIRAAHSAGKPPTGIELRALILYDHIPTDTVKTSIHNVFKGQYGSDMVTAP